MFPSTFRVPSVIRCGGERPDDRNPSLFRWESDSRRRRPSPNPDVPLHQGILRCHWPFKLAMTHVRIDRDAGLVAAPESQLSYHHVVARPEGFILALARSGRSPARRISTYPNTKVPRI